MTGGSLRILRAEHEGALVDLDIVDGMLVDVGPAGSLQRTSDADIDAAGGAVLPGLHDHHVHLLASAAALDSVALDPVRVPGASALAATLRAADAAAPPGEWLRAVGYHESIAGELDRATLDALVPDRPLRVQHRTGALWVLNSAALRLLGDPPEGGTDGRVFRNDEWLRDRIAAVGATRPLSLRAVGEQFVAHGITGVTDLTPSTDPTEFALIASAVAAGDLSLRVTVTGSAALAATDAFGLSLGPVKIVVDDHELPGLDAVMAQIGRARDVDRPVAMHCVTLEGLLLAMVALREVGPRRGDRLEHAAVVPPELFAELAMSGVVVVTQPSFVRERGDRYLLDVDAVDRPHLWRCASLIEHGIGVAFGSDAPYGPIDPWAMVRTAADRTTLGGQVLGADEALPPSAALARLLGAPDTPTVARRLAVGVPADLCLLRMPLADALRTPPAEPLRTPPAEPSPVRATLIGGIPRFVSCLDDGDP